MLICNDKIWGSACHALRSGGIPGRYYKCIQHSDQKLQQESLNDTHVNVLETAHGLIVTVIGTSKDASVQHVVTDVSDSQFLLRFRTRPIAI